MTAIKRNGFTTLQIVCVAATVAAQIAVVQPVIRGVKEQDRVTTCQSNIRDYALAVATYWNDYDAKLPSSVVASDPPGSPTQTQVVNFLTGKGNPWPWNGPARPVTLSQVLSNYIRRPSEPFCPSDTPRTRVSYWWKYAIDLAWRDPTLLVRYEYQYPYAATQVMFYEHAGWHTGDAAGVRDGVRINVVCFDTHVHTVTVRNGPTSYPPSSDERTGAAGIRLGSPMYYNYDNNTQTRLSGVANYVDPRRYSDSF